MSCKGSFAYGCAELDPTAPSVGKMAFKKRSGSMNDIYVQYGGSALYLDMMAFKDGPSKLHLGASCTGGCSAGTSCTIISGSGTNRVPSCGSCGAARQIDGADQWNDNLGGGVVTYCDAGAPAAAPAPSPPPPPPSPPPPSPPWVASTDTNCYPSDNGNDCTTGYGAVCHSCCRKDVSYVETIDDCKARCVATDDCDGVTYYPPASQCFLRHQIDLSSCINPYASYDSYRLMTGADECATDADCTGDGSYCKTYQTPSVCQLPPSPHQPPSPSPPPPMMPPPQNWCATQWSEYSPPNVATCTPCATTADCPAGRDCWGATYCKEHVLCGDANDAECQASVASAPPMLPPPSPSPPPLWESCGDAACNQAVWETWPNGDGTCGQQIQWVMNGGDGSASWDQYENDLQASCNYVAVQASTADDCGPCAYLSPPPSPPPPSPSPPPPSPSPPPPNPPPPSVPRPPCLDITQNVVGEEYQQNQAGSEGNVGANGECIDIGSSCDKIAKKGFFQMGLGDRLEVNVGYDSSSTLTFAANDNGMFDWLRQRKLWRKH
eukprot:scaffold15117_cov59-Phaeocystis_antarctica.AAC.5